jgi:hypothetical protein
VRSLSVALEASLFVCHTPYTKPLRHFSVCVACLQELGKMSYAESVTLLVLLIALAFWVSGGYIKPTPISTMAVAFMALSLLLLTGVLSWEDCLACTFAWDTLFWIAILMVSWQGVCYVNVYNTC